MSSLDRTLRADILRFDLTQEEQEATKPETLERDGRSSRTLLKEDALRVTLIVLGAGGGIPEHQAQGPVTIHPLRGELTVHLGEDTHRVSSNELVALDAAVPHSVSSQDGAAFLLTVTHPPAI